MDQLKTFLNATVKHIFWVVCGVVVILSIGSWYMARSQIQDDFRKNLATIDKSYGTVQQIRKKANHPNPSSEKEMERLIKAVLDSALNAWAAQYAQQTNVLRWPAELGEDFIGAVRPLVPIELKVEYDAAKNPPTPLPQELDVTYKQRYANYVERLLPVLAEMIGAKWGAHTTAGEMGFTGEPGAPTTAEAPTLNPNEKPPVVWWSTSDQGRLLGTHFNWAKQPDSAPTTLQLLYAQEDLWVLRALMSIVRTTNGDAESRHEAVVKSIDSILIGAQASGRAGQVMRFRGAASGSGMPAMYGPAPGAEGPSSTPPGLPPTMPTPGGTAPGTMPGVPMGPSPMGMETMGGGNRSLDPADFRYVGTDYLPLRADKLRSAMKSEKPEDAYYVVAKRMPVRMRLVVDQRKLNRLLVECGNCPLPVEIRQVRINRKGETTATAMDFGGGSGYGESPMGMMPEPGVGPGTMPGFEGGPGMPMGMAPTMGPDMTGQGGGDMSIRKVVSSASEYDVSIELQGIIYIYNPVDKQRLGIQETGEVAAEPASVPAGAAPAGTSPAQG